MAGRRKWSLPRTSRHSRVQPTPDQGGAVVFPLLPLVEKHDHEQGGHHEFNACGVKVDQVPQQGAQGGPGHPVELIEYSDKKHKPAPVHPLRGGTAQWMEKVSSHSPKIR